MGLNKVELEGGLVRPPELQYTQGGYPFCTFTIAVNDTRYNKDAGGQVPYANFFACQVWGERAVQIAVELEFAKGEELYVMGSLDQSEWEDNDGKKQSRTRIKAKMVVRLNPKTDRQPQQSKREDDLYDGPDDELGAPF